MQFKDAIRTIKERLNIADMARRYVELRPQGGARFVAPCPFHQETKPSFSVDADKGFFYCFGCQASGDVISFYAQINGLETKEAISQLAEEAGISIEYGGRERSSFQEKQRRTEKQSMLAMHEAASVHFQSCLINKASGNECREYVAKRGINKEILERFCLGWAEREWHSLENCLRRQGHNLELAGVAGLLGKSGAGNFYDRFRGRLMFPIKNLSNQVIAFGGRIIAEEEEAKYINTSDTPIYGKKEHLYGLAQARRGISAQGCALLTEGYMDVLTLHQFGYSNSVGVLGTALTEEQIQRLSGFTSRIKLLFDGDRAGHKAALRATEMLLVRGLACFVILLPEGEDIDSLLRSAGPDVFDNLQKDAPDGLNFCVSALRELAPREAIDWAKNFLAKVQTPALISGFASTLAQKLGIDENLLREDVAAVSRKPVGNVKKFAAPASLSLLEKDTQILAYAVRYPERLEDLRNLGADIALTHKRSHLLWELIEEHGSEEVFYYLDEKQQKFWTERRNPPAPPRDNPERELEALKEALDRHYAKNQALSLKSAMTGDFAADLQYLCAIRDAMRKDNEQS